MKERLKVRQMSEPRLRSISTRATVAALAAIVFALACAGPAAADGIPALGPDGEVTVPPFGVGERLVFEIGYGFVNAGTAVMGIPDVVSERGHLCYHIVSMAETNSFFSAFFEVRDVVESFLDTREMVSRRFEKHIREGDYRTEDLVIFDHDRHIAAYPKRKGELIPLALAAQDILSSLYYVRMMELEVGKSIFIENHADRKNYPLEIKVLRRETVDVPAGKFDCLVVEPILRAAGLFKSEGKLTVWLTNDEHKIPVQMRSKVIIGSISAELSELEYSDSAVSGLP